MLILLTIALTVIFVPILAFMVVKFGTAGYLTARRQFNKQNQTKEDKNEQTK